MMREPLATLLQGAVCRTRVKHRPSPSLFLFPGLTSRPWHDPRKFPWVEKLESVHDKIRTEYLDIVKKGGSDYKVGKNEEKLHHGEWDWHSYISKGEKDSSFKQHCPETARILESIPAMADTPFSFAFFSTLSSKSSISAHTAPCNIRLRCHFPLIVPTDDTAKCGMRVADEKRSWYPGKAIIFDDSFEHEVWNHSSAERVVLLFDIWHPDLHQDEIEAIKDMFLFAKEQKWMS